MDEETKDNLDEGLFRSLFGLFGNTGRKIEKLKKIQEALRAITVSLSQMDDISPRRIQYVEKLLDSADREISYLMNHISSGKKIKRKKRVYTDDLY